MITRLSHFVFGLLVLCIPVFAQNPRPDPAAWTLQNQNPEDGVANRDGDAIVLGRGPKGADAYMTRAFQDLPLTGGRQLLLRMTIHVDGPGAARASVYTAGPDGRWDESHILSGDPVRQTPEAQPTRAVFPIPEGVVKIRISLGLYGAQTRARIRDVAMEDIGEFRSYRVVPSTAAVKLDGVPGDSLWTNAVVLRPFRVLGDITRTAAFADEARVAVHDGYLYVSGRFEEPEPAGLQALKENVLAIHNDDCAEIFLSTDRTAYSHILVNSAGARYWDWKTDGRPSPTWYPSIQADFQGDWDARAAVGKREWTWEFRVRIHDLFERAVSGDQTIYVNVARHRSRGDEPDTTWAPLSGTSFHVPREFPLLTLALPADSAQTPVALIPGVFTQRLSVPETLITGRPVRMDLHKKRFALPSQCDVQDAIGLPAPVLDELRTDLNVGEGPATTVTLGLGDPSADGEWTGAQRRKLDGPEAFRLTLAPGRVEILGRTRDGVLRGIATLRLMARRARIAPDASLPALTLWDGPGMAYRGFMLHSSEPIGTVKRNIDSIFLLRMNKVVMDLSSHSARTWFPFETLPIGRTDRTKEDWAEIFQYARDHGIEPIPYMHTWSRVQYFGHAPDTERYFADTKGSANYPSHRNLDVANPETHPIMLGLQKEIVDLVHPANFHIALDEVHFSSSVTSRAAMERGWKPSDWYREAIAVNEAFAKQRGYSLSIWGDMIDPDQNGRHMDINGTNLLALLPKDLTIYDWKYEGKFDKARTFPSIAMFKTAGFRTIGCPWYLPNNIARIAKSVYEAGADGLCGTAWSDTNPDRLAPEIIRAAGLDGYLSWSPEETDLSTFPLVPDALLQTALYGQTLSRGTGKARSLRAPEAALTGGADLMKWMGLPERMDSAFLATPFTDPRGVSIQPFLRDGKPAALAVTGTGRGFRNSHFTRGLEGWIVQTPGPECRFDAQEGILCATRDSGQEFMRAYQDIPMDPDRMYTVRARMKADSGIEAMLTVYPGDSSLRFDGTRVKTASTKNADWTPVEIPLPPRTASVRLGLTMNGSGGSARFQSVELISDRAEPATSGPSVFVPVKKRARTVTFLHALSAVPILERFGQMAQQYGSMDPGTYRVMYEDGGSEQIPLDYRETISAVDDSILGRHCGAGLFGTLGRSCFVNIATLAWTNPHPEKRIERIEILPGSSRSVALLLFGIAIE